MKQRKFSIGNGVAAGFIATAVLSVVMLMKEAMGLMPQLNPVAMISSMMGASTPVMGWIVHFMIGTLAWGILYAILEPRLPGKSWVRGAVFATGAWLMMMVAMMPMAGAGIFGMALGLGIMAPVATLLMHWLYGAVLGWTYDALMRRHEPKHSPVLSS